MLTARLHPLIWLTLLAFAVSSCSTAINVRSEDYARIDTEQTYRIVMRDGKEYEAHNLVVDVNEATFTTDGEKKTVPTDQIQLIQKINDNELVTGLVVIGIAGALAAGLVIIFAQD
jgi:hypothetical protein